MTGKRFRYDSALEKVYDDDTYNGETTESYGVFECCEIMNEQHEQIHRLKQNIDELMQLDVEEELLKENEQLKSENEWLKSIRFANDVLKENKELKSFIKKLTSNDGKIWLMNGYVYKTDKILKKGDVE